MFKNIGKQVKFLAKLFAGILIFSAVVGGISLIISGITEKTAFTLFIGVLVVAFGILSAWISNIFIYAFGELVDSTTNTERILSEIQHDFALFAASKSNYSVNSANNKNNTKSSEFDEISYINKLLDDGLITEEEYENIIKSVLKK